MGCGNSVPAKYAKNDPNYGLNVPIQIQDGCGPAGTVQNYLSKFMPQNGEYAWAGEGETCFYDSAEVGSTMPCNAGCSKDRPGHCAIVGRRGKFKRIKYGADPTDCCLKKATPQGLIGTQTCDPKYRNPSSPDCQNIIQDSCTQDDNIFNQRYCQSYCNNTGNLDWCNNVKSTYCNNKPNVNNAYCKPWCKDNIDKCSSGIQNYCLDGDKVFNDDLCNSYCSTINGGSWCDNTKSTFCNNPENISNSKCQSYCKKFPDKCKTSLHSYCSSGDRAFKDDLCVNYCTGSGKDWCSNTKAAYCNNPANTSTATCQTWCQENMGKCDDGMTKYCSKEGLGKPICKCLNSPAAKFNPLCIDAECAKSGYTTNSMIVGRGNGCKVIDCSQYLGLKDAVAGGQIKLDANFEQNCGNELNPPPTPEPTSIPPVAPPVAPTHIGVTPGVTPTVAPTVAPGSSSVSTGTVIGVTAGVGVSIGLIAILIILYKKNSK